MLLTICNKTHHCYALSALKAHLPCVCFAETTFSTDLPLNDAYQYMHWLPTLSAIACDSNSVGDEIGRKRFLKLESSNGLIRLCAYDEKLVVIILFHVFFAFRPWW